MNVEPRGSGEGCLNFLQKETAGAERRQTKSKGTEEGD